MIISNIRLDIPNGKVVKLAQNVRGKDWMTRKEIREWIEEMVNVYVEGRNTDPYPRTSEAPEEDAGEGGLVDRRSDGISGFVPSRGDEPYLYKAQSTALKERCSEMLDLAKKVDDEIWKLLELNRDE